MGSLTITGDNAKLKVILREKRYFARKYGLKVVLDEKGEGASSPNPTGDSKPLKAEEVADIIKQCVSLDELNEYADDTRQIVSRVYKAKLKELTNDID
jgi:hypothetical protein